MKRMSVVKSFAAASLAAALCGCDPAAVRLTAVNAEVAVAPGAPPATRFAAAEMTNYLSQVFGAPVPLVTAPTQGKYTIFLGTNEWSRAAGLAPESLRRDSFCVKIGEGCAFVAGCDDPRRDIAREISLGNVSCFERATLFGVYGFLDRHVGIRFYFPGELGTVVPRAESVDLPLQSYSVTPRFSTRYCYVRGAGPYPGIDPGDSRATGSAKARYKLIMREDTGHVSCCHGQNRFKIAERFSKSHPEYFQLRKDGTRCVGTEFPSSWMGRQLCHTSKVWDIFRAETIERVRKSSGTDRYVDVMPQDGMSPCWCENCQKSFNTTNLTLSSGYASELIWSNTVAVAKAVTAAGLDGGVSQMAYGSYRSIPSVDIPENVKVVLAVGGPWAESHPDIRDKQIEFVRTWAEKLKRPVAWIWTYPMKNYGRLQAPDVPQVAPRAYAKFYTLAEPYIDGSFVESNVGETLVQNYLNFYVFSKIAWDGKVDVEAVLAEHHRLMFGAGAAGMSKFFDALERKWIGEIALPSLIGETEIGPMLYGPSEYDLWTSIYSAAFIGELDGYLKEASSAVADGSIEARRVAWIREELFERVAKRARTYQSEISVDVERARRAASRDAKVIVESGSDWKGWGLPRGCLREGTAVRLVSTNNVCVGFELKGAAALKPNTTYRLSYFVKTEDVRRLASGGGACMEVEQYGVKYSMLRKPSGSCLHGTKDWMHQSLEFKTNDDVVKHPGYKARLRLWLSKCVGSAWFDGVRLEEVEAPGPGM